MGCSESREATNSGPRNNVSTRGSPKAHHDQNVACHQLRQLSAFKRDSAYSKAESMLLLTKGQRFYDNYVRPTLVSYGATCKVLTAFNRDTQRKYAVKTILKSNRNPENQREKVLKEVGVLKEVEDHPNAVKLVEVYDDVQNYYLVMECCDGGELFEHIAKGTDAFTERHAANILKSLMLFLAHMHAKGIAHMDIKPENIMFDAEGTNGVVKVIDFGASDYVQPDETINDAFGTVRYSSPEMAADSGIGQRTDVWSAGALMYFMLCGSAPFLKKDDVDTLNYIKKKPKVKFPGKRWAAVSEDAKDCILAMLEVDPALRPTAQQVLQMAWLRTAAHDDRADPMDVSIRRDILDHLRTFANQSRMRRLLLGLMASSISGGEANRLLDHFYAMDSDFSGTIEMSELALVAKQVLPDLTELEVSNLFSALDLNHTGTVDVKEFFASLLQTMDPENRIAVARRSFRDMDRDRSGFLSKKVFMDEMVRQAILSGMDANDAAQLELELEAEFRALDTNSDGQLSFEEFQSVLGLDAPARPISRHDHTNVQHTATACLSKRTTPLPGSSSEADLKSRSVAAVRTSTDSSMLLQLALKIRDQSRAHSMVSQGDGGLASGECRQDFVEERSGDQRSTAEGEDPRRSSSAPDKAAALATVASGGMKASRSTLRLSSACRLASRDPAASAAAAVAAAVAVTFKALADSGDVEYPLSGSKGSPGVDALGQPVGYSDQEEGMGVRFRPNPIARQDLESRKSATSSPGFLPFHPTGSTHVGPKLLPGGRGFRQASLPRDGGAGGSLSRFTAELACKELNLSPVLASTTRRSVQDNDEDVLLPRT